MDDKVNYAWVGAFVLVLSGLLVAGVLWLAAGVGGRRAMDDFQAVIQESVAGLDVNAPVKYLGVDVGKVVGIGIDPQNSQQVRLRFRIARGTPIKHDTVAVLKAQGLTGIAYVELSGGTALALPLLPGEDGEPPTIPFKSSLSARLESVLGDLVGMVDRVSGNVNAILDADNRAAIKSTLADLALLSHALAGQRAAFERGVHDAARTAAVASRAAERIAPTLERVEASAAAVERMAEVARSASARAGDTADAATLGVQQLGVETLPELTRLMAELSRLSAVLRQLGDQTLASPSSLLVGVPAPQPGPGESVR